MSSTLRDKVAVRWPVRLSLLLAFTLLAGCGPNQAKLDELDRRAGKVSAEVEAMAIEDREEPVKMRQTFRLANLEITPLSVREATEDEKKDVPGFRISNDASVLVIDCKMVNSSQKAVFPPETNGNARDDKGNDCDVEVEGGDEKLEPGNETQVRLFLEEADSQASEYTIEISTRTSKLESDMLNRSTWKLTLQKPTAQGGDSNSQP